MISEKFKHAGDSVFYEMTKLANENQAINLAQGFPNFEGPELLKDVFANEIKNGWNQYISSPGLAELREELAKHYSERYQLNYHPETEITITHGATEALFNVLTGLLSPGDEVIIFEPFYDAYIGAIQLAGAKARAVRIDSLTFEIEWQSLEKQLNPAVKMILINTPHNPIGKLFSSDELNRIAVLAKQHDLVIVSDEVYEHITFDGKSHQSIAQIPGMQERTIVISSIAKTYSFTGWKVGWVMSPSKLTRGIRLSHQLSTFCTNQAGQKAAVSALRLNDDYYTELKSSYQQKRDLLVNGLNDLGFSIKKPEGTYFFMADYSQLSDVSSWDFARFLVEKFKVAVIPPDSFYQNQFSEKVVRFCFSKTNDLLEDALEAMRNLA